MEMAERVSTAVTPNVTRSLEQRRTPVQRWTMRNQVLEPCGLPVEPEADPAEHHDEGAGQVDLDEEVAGVALQQKHDLHSTVLQSSLGNKLNKTDRSTNVKTTLALMFHGLLCCSIMSQKTLKH